jgi:hypothetical protein
MTVIASLNRLYCPLCGQRIHVWHTSQFDQSASDTLVVITRWVGGVAQLGVAHVHQGEPEALSAGMSHFCSGVERSTVGAET